MFDNYWDNFYQQNQRDNLHAQTGSENSQAPQMANGLSNTTATPKKIRMIGYHDPVTPENSPP